MTFAIFNSLQGIAFYDDGGGDGDGGDGKIRMALVVTDVDDEDNMHSGGTVPPFFLASVWKQNCNLKNIHFHSQREMYL